MKLDILVMAAHPDDAELGCAGTILAHIAQGKKVGMIDFTKGDLGTRGTPQLRLQEADTAARILGLSVRENMGFADGFFKNDEEHQRALIKLIRKYQPEVVLANAPEDRHPDHGKASSLASDACFLAGLRKIETSLDGKNQEAWRPRSVYYYIQDRLLKPDLIVDISEYWDQKVKAINAFKSQFFTADTDSDEPQTYISSPEFMAFIEGRASEFGHSIGVRYGEGFVSQRKLGVKSLFEFL
jgi:N-acetylglucosamine malate deacetylase 1